MKALEYLKKEREIKKHCADVAWGYYDKNIDEAIKELEELKNRSCATCKYGRSFHFDEDIECMKLYNATQGLCFEKDFYCKNWERK